MSSSLFSRFSTLSIVVAAGSYLFGDQIAAAESAVIRQWHLGMGEISWSVGEIPRDLLEAWQEVERVWRDSSRRFVAEAGVLKRELLPGRTKQQP